MNKMEIVDIREIPVVFGDHGVELHGKILIPDNACIDNPVPAAILCHGFGSDHRVMESSALLLVKKGIATMVFDLRGHGMSKGQLDGDFHEDIIDAWHKLVELPEIDRERIALIGHSLGAVSSILATRKIMKPKAIVALACPAEMNQKLKVIPFAHSIFTLVGRLVVHFSDMKLRINWKHFLESWPDIRLSTALDKLDECAKLFVFSADDPLSSFKRFMNLYENAPGPKQKMLTLGSHVTSIEAEIIRFEWIGWTVSALATPKVALQAVKI